MEIPSAEQSVNSIISNMHKIAQANQAVGISIGTVISPPPELKIAWNNIVLEPDDLYIDQFLLPNYQRNLKGNEEIPKAEGSIKTSTKNKQGGAGKPRYVSHQHKINSSYKASVEGDYKASAIYTDCGLQAGDLVSLLPIADGQKFIVLGKIIYLPEFQFEEGEISSDLL